MKDKFTFEVTFDLKNIKKYSRNLRNLGITIPFKNLSGFRRKLSDSKRTLSDSDREKQIVECLSFIEDIMMELKKIGVERAVKNYAEKK